MVLFLLVLAACSSDGGQVSPTLQPTAPAATAAILEPTVEPTATVEPTVAPTAEPTEEPEVVEPEGAELDAFIMSLETAVTDQDFAQMAALANEPIAIGGWRSEWRMYDPAQMSTEFQNGSLPAPTDVIFTGLTDEEITALIGQPPATMFSPDTNYAAALHSSGWGEDGTDDAILFIVEEDGQYSWFAFLYTFGAFADANQVGEVIETDVAYIMAMQDVTMYDGPNESFNVIGGVADGQTALVTGQFSENGWWRVICPDDTIGDCWVTNDTDFMVPTG
jgi:hypothetical protein